MRRLATLGVAGCTLVVMTCWGMEIAVACINDLYPELGACAAAIERQVEQARVSSPASARLSTKSPWAVSRCARPALPSNASC